MSLAKRIVPTVLCRGKTAYKGPGFGGHCTRSVGSVLSIVQVHAKRGVDEIVIMDVSATVEGRGPDLGLIREITATCFTPVTVGGGVKTIADINALLRAGADKVAICTAANDGVFLREAADHFGSQAIVVVIEHDDGAPLKTAARARWAQRAGAGEIVLQSRPRDGTMMGYDLESIEWTARALRVPLIASGGCSGPDDMLAAIKAGADGVAAGALFQFTDETPRSCAKALKSAGVEVRL